MWDVKTIKYPQKSANFTPQVGRPIDVVSIRIRLKFIFLYWLRMFLIRCSRCNQMITFEFLLVDSYVEVMDLLMSKTTTWISLMHRLQLRLPCDFRSTHSQSRHSCNPCIRPYSQKTTYQNFLRHFIFDLLRLNFAYALVTTATAVRLSLNAFAVASVVTVVTPALGPTLRKLCTKTFRDIWFLIYCTELIERQSAISTTSGIWPLLKWNILVSW